MITARTIMLGFAAVAVTAAGSSALTASNSLPATTVGYGTSSITGATATSIVYTLDGPGSLITAVTILITGDITSGKVVKSAFDAEALSSCTIGAYSNPSTTVTCDYTGHGGGGVATSSVAAFHVAVLNN